MKETRTCSICLKQKTILKNSWHANNTCSACYAKAKYTTSNRHESKKAWRLANKEKHDKYMREYKANRIKNDEQYKIKNALRKRITEAIKNNQKAGSAIEDLGCSIEFLKSHLESKFKDNMNWDNYGEWHIDHIRPLTSFDLTKEADFKIACHYTNLQPLWAEENLKKSDTYEQ